MGSLVPIRVSPGPPSNAASRHRAIELQRLYREEFAQVRAQAEKWRNGLAGLLGLITSVNLVKGPDALDKRPDPTRPDPPSRRSNWQRSLLPLSECASPCARRSVCLAARLVHPDTCRDRRRRGPIARVSGRRRETMPPTVRELCPRKRKPWSGLCAGPSPMKSESDPSYDR